jgi:hypothetical protein
MNLRDLKQSQIRCFLQPTKTNVMKSKTTNSTADMTELSHTSIATRAVDSIMKQPKTPVHILWQMQAFPIRIARKLVAKGYRVLWVVGSKERGDTAESEMSKVGIAVRRCKPEVVAVAAPIDLESLSAIQRLRLKERAKRAKRDAFLASDYGQPETATVTIVPLQALQYDRPLDEIPGWDSCIAVFDHIGVTGCRWVELQLGNDDENEEADPDILLTKVRDDDKHPIPVFHRRGLPLIFIERDELAGALIAADFNRRDASVTSFRTGFVPPKEVETSIVGTDLVWTQYAAGAFLSILVSGKGVSVVGEALLGGITPDSLSTNPQADFGSTVLKISNLWQKVVMLDCGQTKLSKAELVSMRMRDFIRTTMLSINSSKHKPELVILCPYNLSATAAGFLGKTPLHLARWNPNRPDLSVDGTAFTQQVIAAASTYPRVIAHAGRFQKIVDILSGEHKKLPGKFGRLALALHEASGQDETYDLTNRAEDIEDPTGNAYRAKATFEALLEATCPWSARKPEDRNSNLAVRRQVLDSYRKLRRQRLKKLGVNSANA